METNSFTEWISQQLDVFVGLIMTCVDALIIIFGIFGFIKASRLAASSEQDADVGLRTWRRVALTSICSGLGGAILNWLIILIVEKVSYSWNATSSDIVFINSWLADQMKIWVGLATTIASKFLVMYGIYGYAKAVHLEISDDSNAAEGLRRWKKVTLVTYMSAFSMAILPWVILTLTAKFSGGW